MKLVGYIRNFVALLFLIVSAPPFIISALLSTPEIKASVRQILRKRLFPEDVAFPTATADRRD
jgi:hypothetical protein